VSGVLSLKSLFNLFALALLPKRTVEQCPLCGCKAFSRFKKIRYQGLLISLVRCEKCTLVLQSPRLTEEALERFYATEYRLDQTDSHGRNQYERGQRRGTYIVEYLSENGKTLGQGDTILEVGCGHGGILGHLQDVGCIVAGCDPESIATEYAKSQGLDIRHGFDDQLSDFEGKADAVVLSHVLEHVEEPIKFLSKIGRLLKSEGVIYVEVPGINNPRVVHKGYGAQLGHLVYFTEKTLRDTASAAGYEVIDANELAQSILWKQ